MTDLQEEIKILKSVGSSTLKNLSEESLLPIDPADVEKWLKEMQKKLASIGIISLTPYYL